MAILVELKNDAKKTSFWLDTSALKVPPQAPPDQVRPKDRARVGLGLYQDRARRRPGPTRRALQGAPGPGLT